MPAFLEQYKRMAVATSHSSRIDHLICSNWAWGKITAQVLPACMWPFVADHFAVAARAVLSVPALTRPNPLSTRGWMPADSEAEVHYKQLAARRLKVTEDLETAIDNLEAFQSGIRDAALAVKHSTVSLEKNLRRDAATEGLMFEAKRRQSSWRRKRKRRNAREAISQPVANFRAAAPTGPLASCAVQGRDSTNLVEWRQELSARAALKYGDDSNDEERQE